MRTRFKIPLYAVLGAGVVLACEARATPPAAAIPLPPPASDRFRPENTSVAEDSPVARARHALEAEVFADARSIAEGAVATASPADAPRLRMIAGLAALAAGDTSGGVAHLASFDDLPAHPLALWAKLSRASALEATDPALSLRLASELSVNDFPGKTPARRLEARLRLSTGDTDGAMVTLRSLVAEESGEALAEVAVPFVAALVARGDEASLSEALDVQHRLFARAPRTSAGRSAETEMASLASRIGASARSRRQPSVVERIEHADALAAGRSDDALSAYDAALAAMDEGDERRCAVRLNRARIVERGRDRHRTATELVALADACEGDEIRGWALFKAGRAQQQANLGDAALETYARLERDAPGSRYADDGALYAARIHLSAGRVDEGRAALSAIVDRYPSGDMRADAWFLNAWALRDSGQKEAALALLHASRAAIPVEPGGEENAGRAAYWEARTLADLSRRDEAIAAYDALARAMPLTYYGMSALSRLAELDADRAGAVRSFLATTPAPIEIPLDQAIDRVAFARAHELLLVGREADATAELYALGLIGEGASDDKLFAAASLFATTDHPNDAVDLVRRKLADARALPPTGLARAQLRLGYPRAYAPMIEDAARARSLPAAFVRAIAREESSFNPNAVSRAHAYGLIQILVPTARGYARDIGIEPNANNLRDPHTNVLFGTAFMARLFRRYQVNPALVPAAYNAGHGSVERWLRLDRVRPFDEFVEEIPFEETRRYTRRVLQSYGIYSLLDTGELPSFGSALPPE